MTFQPCPWPDHGPAEAAEPGNPGASEQPRVRIDPAFPMQPSASTCLIVSVTGVAAISATPASTCSAQRSKSAGSTRQRHRRGSAHVGPGQRPARPLSTESRRVAPRIQTTGLGHCTSAWIAPHRPPDGCRSNGPVGRHRRSQSPGDHRASCQRQQQLVAIRSHAATTPLRRSTDAQATPASSRLKRSPQSAQTLRAASRGPCPQSWPGSGSAGSSAGPCGCRGRTGSDGSGGLRSHLPRGLGAAAGF